MGVMKFFLYFLLVACDRAVARAFSLVAALAPTAVPLVYITSGLAYIQYTYIENTQQAIRAISFLP